MRLPPLQTLPPSIGCIGITKHVQWSASMMEDEGRLELEGCITSNK
ncbi:hypothetical protein M8C21_001285, partial [Ambrosia artemisiifolia]